MSGTVEAEGNVKIIHGGWLNLAAKGCCGWSVKRKWVVLQEEFEESLWTKSYKLIYYAKKIGKKPTERGVQGSYALGVGSTTEPAEKPKENTIVVTTSEGKVFFVAGSDDERIRWMNQFSSCGVKDVKGVSERFLFALLSFC